MNVNLSIEGETHIDIDCELIAPLWFVKKNVYAQKDNVDVPCGKRKRSRVPTNNNKKESISIRGAFPYWNRL